MAVIKHKDKRTGVTYVYESESYWDKEKKQPRSKRTLIGKVDEVTGEIIPTGKSSKKKSDDIEGNPSEVKPISDQIELISQKDEIIKELKAENTALRKEKEEVLSILNKLIEKISN